MVFKVFVFFMSLNVLVAFKTTFNSNHRSGSKHLQYSIIHNHNLAILDTIIHAIRPIPVELSASDTIISTATNSLSSLSSISGTDKPLILPNTEIQQLDGGFNLGILLWTFVLYYGGPLPLRMSLADTILPYLVYNSSSSSIDSTLSSYNNGRVEQQENNSMLWYKDYQDGYTFTCPPALDLFRIALFGVLGYVVNALWIDSLGGDVYWGWATAGSLSIPTALIALGRVRRVTREVGMLENTIKSNFREFRDTRLIRKKAMKCNEEAILKAYQRTYGKFDYTTSGSSNSNNTVNAAMYSDTRNSRLNKKKGFGNTEDDVTIGEMSEKILLRLMRGWYGSRPSVDGNYNDLELLPPFPVSTPPSSMLTIATNTKSGTGTVIALPPKASEFSISSGNSSNNPTSTLSTSSNNIPAVKVGNNNNKSNNNNSADSGDDADIKETRELK